MRGMTEARLARRELRRRRLRRGDAPGARARARPARARRRGRGRTPDAEGDARGSASHRPLALPPAPALGRHGAPTSWRCSTCRPRSPAAAPRPAGTSRTSASITGCWRSTTSAPRKRSGARIPDALIASGIAYPQGSGRRVDGGFVVSGFWNFSSGVDASDWNMLAVMVRDGERVVDHRMCLVPQSDYEIVDDWTRPRHAQHRLQVGARQGRVRPEHRALSHVPGARRQPVSGRARQPESALPGAARRARLALPGGGRRRQRPGGARADHRGRSASAAPTTPRCACATSRPCSSASRRAGAMVDAARLVIRADCLEAERIARAGRVPTIEEKLRFKRNVAYAMELCTEAVDTLHALAGANGIYDRYPIQRLFRDQHALAGAHRVQLGRAGRAGRWCDGGFAARLCRRGEASPAASPDASAPVSSPLRHVYSFCSDRGGERSDTPGSCGGRAVLLTRGQRRAVVAASITASGCRSIEQSGASRRKRPLISVMARRPRVSTSAGGRLA